MKKLLIGISVLGSTITLRAMEKDEVWQNKDFILNKYEGLLLNYAWNHTTPRQMKKLFKKNVDVNAKDHEGNTALHLAAQKGKAEIVTFLLKKGAKKELINDRGSTAYQMAHKRVKHLLTNEAIIDLISDDDEKGEVSDSLPEINVNNKRLGEPLESSTTKRPRLDESVNTQADNNLENEQAPRGKRLFFESEHEEDQSSHSDNTIDNKRKGDELAPSIQKRSPLTQNKSSDDGLSQTDFSFEKDFIRAANACNKSMVGQYLELGLNINLPNRKGNTPLHTAARLGRVGLVKLLLSKGADIYALNKALETVFEIAAENVRPLLDKEYERLENKFESEAMALILSNMHENANVSQNLGTEQNTNATATQIHEVTLTTSANVVIDDHVDRMDWEATVMLEQLSTVSQTNPLNKQQEALGAVKISINSEVVAQTQPKQSPQRKISPIVSMALALMAEPSNYAFIDVKAKDEKGLTILHAASVHNSAAFIIDLIDKGADVNAQDNDGLTPLHYAILQGKAEIVSLLIKKGALVNQPDKLGITPLMFAASKSAELQLLLIAHGANMEARDKLGRSFRDYLPTQFQSLF